MGATEPAYLILTWGCQMNEDDSLQMASLLEQMGYRRTSDESEADIIMLNTCSVRAKPEQKVLSRLGELRLLKEAKRSLIIGVSGCMAQRDGAKLLKRVPFVDLVVGTANITELPLLIQQVREGNRRLLATDLPDRKGGDGIAHTSRSVNKVGLKAFVPVMYGCNNFCAYCVVPYARGPERSRLPGDVIAEVTELVSRGTREVTLVGQNVNSYGQTVSQGGADFGDSAENHTDFASLLARVNDIPGLERIRFTTSHPKDLSDRLIEAMATLPKVCEHLHLPLQAGDDDVLRRMGRGYTVERYMAVVEKLRERVPGISLTTDIMVGFPGETDEQFRNTIRTVEAVGFDAAFMFAFNPRPGTAAVSMGDQIESKVKSERLTELIALQNEMTIRNNETRIGEVFEVLAESQSEKGPEKMTGFVRANKTMNFPASPEIAGQLVMVRATAAHLWGFSGELVEP